MAPWSAGKLASARGYGPFRSSQALATGRTGGVGLVSRRLPLWLTAAIVALLLAGCTDKGGAPTAEPPAAVVEARPAAGPTTTGTASGPAEETAAAAPAPAGETPVDVTLVAPPVPISLPIEVRVPPIPPRFEEAAREAAAPAPVEREEAARGAEEVTGEGRSGASMEGQPRMGDGGDALPGYPWPPEEPSSLVRLDTGHDFSRSGSASLFDVAETLGAALRTSGYLELSYYRAPGGFAMVTRLEGITPDGKPLGDSSRYLLPNDERDFSFTDFIRGLFFAPEGYYRFIVFIVTDIAYTTREERLSEAAAISRLRRGGVALPAEFRTMPFSPAHRVDALIYEFHKGGRDGEVETLRPGRIPPIAHLQKSGLMSALGD